MPERFPPSREPEQSNSKESDIERYPTKAELEYFEVLERMGQGPMHVFIENIAKDPQKPTQEEIEYAETLNKAFDDSPTFEQHFGYPDSRKQAGGQRARPDDDHQA
jgi:hypothetical protein